MHNGIYIPNFVLEIRPQGRIELDSLEQFVESFTRESKDVPCIACGARRCRALAIEEVDNALNLRGRFLQPRCDGRFVKALWRSGVELV